MDKSDIKPKLAFFQYGYDESLPEFLLIQKEEHVKCLAQFFEVTVIDHDCDYQQVCDIVQPDLTLIESGVSYPSCSKLKVTNTRACHNIPKLGLMNSDSFCSTRASFVSDMDHWGIDTAFAIATTAEEHTPNIVDHLFVWPVFIDDDVYRDYGETKYIPVLFTGNANAIYPWRQRMMRILPKYYASVTSSHPGYVPRRKRANESVRLMVGERYARMLNAAQFVPACGTVAKEIIRKHFEVPACNSCLVTEASEVLEAAGFADMENCVFADDHDVIDKLDYLFSHRQELNAITQAGYQLVRSRHTLRHRDQIRQWFDLRRVLRPGQEIAQQSPFEPLHVVNLTAGSKPLVVSSSPHLMSLQDGDKKLIAGNYGEAQKLYTRCWNYIPWMPEPQLRIAICQLHKGNPHAALQLIENPLRLSLIEYQAYAPDPVEWAYFIIALLCQGRLREAADRAAQFGSLNHVELDRARAAVRLLYKQAVGRVGKVGNSRVSIHRLPAQGYDEWMGQLGIMLKACGRREFAETLQRAVSKESSGAPERLENEGLPETTCTDRQAAAPVGLARLVRKHDQILLERGLYTGLRRKGRRLAAYLLHGLERRFGYFLPYQLSSARHDEFYEQLEQLARKEPLTSVLIIGANRKQHATAAILEGIRQNRNNVAVLCLGATLTSTSPVSALQWYCLYDSSPREDKETAEQLLATIENFKSENNVKSFDLVLIDASELHNQFRELGNIDGFCREATFVVVDDLDLISNYSEYNVLDRSEHHELLAHNITLRAGYAIYANHFDARCRTHEDGKCSCTCPRNISG